MSERTPQERRLERLEALLAKYGCATECDPIDPDCVVGERNPSAGIGRWALMEADEGPADNGGPWWTIGDEWRDLLEESATQDSPSSWPAVALFDLDSDWETSVKERLRYAPEADPPALPLEVEYQGETWMVYSLEYVPGGCGATTGRWLLKKSPKDRRRRSYDWVTVDPADTNPKEITR